MVKIRTLVLCLLLALFLCSCNGGGEKSLGLFSDGFTCEYSYIEKGMTVRVRLTSRQGSQGRVMSLSFLEPSSLVGVVCESGLENCRVRCGEIDITGEAAEALMVSAKLFCEPSATKFCERTVIDGQTLERFKAVFEDGREASVYIDGSTELPVKISGEVCGRQFELNIISFERLGG